MKKLAIIFCGLFCLSVWPCEHGDRVDCWVNPSGTNWQVVKIDRCIAPIISALNSNGISTLASCCGHGTNGYILLKDRILIVTPRTNSAAVKALYNRDWNSFGEQMERKTFWERKK